MRLTAAIFVIVYKIGLFAMLVIFPILYVYGWYTKSNLMGDGFWFYNYTTDEGMVSFTHLLSILAIHYFFVFLLNGLFALHIVNYENLQQLIKISEANGSLPSIGRNVDRASVVLRQPQENSGTPETRTAPTFSEK